MRNSMRPPIDAGYITMMILVLLGLLVMVGVFVVGPIVDILK